MALSQTELILSLPTTILSIVSFFAASYIAISAYLMHKARQKRLQTTVINNAACAGIFNSQSFSSRSQSQQQVMVNQQLLYSPSHFHPSFNESPMLICHHIFWMSVCDAIFSFWNICSWFPKLFKCHFVDFSSISCKIFGVIKQFIMSAGVAWYLMIAWCLCSVVFGFSSLNIANFNKTKKIHHFIVWLIAFILTIIPFYPLDEYGPFTNVERDDVMGNDTECWISNRLYFISFYGLVGITLCFALFLLMYISFRWKCPMLRLVYKRRKKCICCLQCCRKARSKKKRKMEHQPSIQHYDLRDDISESSASKDVLQFAPGYVFGGLSVENGEMITRLELFTLVFIVVWIGPFCVRMYNFLCDECIAPVWATCLHHYGINLLGLGNALVWSQSKNFHSAITSFKELYKHGQEQLDEEFVGQFSKAISNM